MSDSPTANGQVHGPQDPRPPGCRCGDMPSPRCPVHMGKWPAPAASVRAQHDETGRMWEGPRDQIPNGYSEILTSNVRSDEQREWQFVYRTLRDCRDKLQAGGVRRSWIDPAVDIALARAALDPKALQFYIPAGLSTDRAEDVATIQKAIQDGLRGATLPPRGDPVAWALLDDDGEIHGLYTYDIVKNWPTAPKGTVVPLYRAAPPPAALLCEMEPENESHDLSNGVVCIACWNKVAARQAEPPSGCAKCGYSKENHDNPDEFVPRAVQPPERVPLPIREWIQDYARMLSREVNAAFAQGAQSLDADVADRKALLSLVDQWLRATAKKGEG